MTLFPLPHPRPVPIAGMTEDYPVHRIFCVGRNYAEHAKEMGVEVDREDPFYFLKASVAIADNNATIPYPPGTANYHYEMELVVALGAPLFKAPIEAVQGAIFGYAAGLDMTRRDLQLDARAKGRPWDLGKNFEQSAIVAPISRATEIADLGYRQIRLEVNGTVRQQARLSDLVWSVSELLSHLSQYYHLQPGDLIFTGTPAGVGPVVPGDVLRGEVDGLAAVGLTVGAPE